MSELMDGPVLPWADDALRRVGPSLAYDIVAGLRPLPELLNRYGLTPHQAKAIGETVWFRAMVNEARTRWGSELGAVERIRLKSMVALEESLQVPYVIANNPEAAPTARLEAIKTMERLAGVVPPQAAGLAGDGGSKFSITINLGDGKMVSASIVPDAVGAGVGGELVTSEVSEALGEEEEEGE